MNAAELAALAAIDAAFGETVSYSGPGVADPIDLRVIWSDVSGEAFQGAGNTVRTITCEVRKSLLPVQPNKTSRIVRGAITWKPQQVVDRDDVAGWVVTLERA